MPARPPDHSQPLLIESPLAHTTITTPSTHTDTPTHPHTLQATTTLPATPDIFPPSMHMCMCAANVYVCNAGNYYYAVNLGLTIREMTALTGGGHSIGG